MQNNIVYKYKLPRSLWPTFYTPVDIFCKNWKRCYCPGERSLGPRASSVGALDLCVRFTDRHDHISISGSILLDLEASDLPTIVTHVVENMVIHDQIKSENKGHVKMTLLMKHK